MVTMRLRLLIARHGLPSVKIIWNAQPESTVAELLEHLDNFVPLEAEEWGLEDYAVQVAGYEALHFQKLEDVFKDGDEVTFVLPCPLSSFG